LRLDGGILTKICRFLLVIAGFAAFAAQPALAGFREAAMLEFINKMRSQERARQLSFTVDLHANYAQVKNEREKHLLALALGVQYMDKNPRLALQFLTSADLGLAPKDPLHPIVSYYLAEAKFRGGSYRETIEILRNLSTHEFGDAWNKRVQSLLIESYNAAGDYTQLTSAFTEFSKRYTFSKRQEVLAKMAYEALEKNNENFGDFAILEGLAVNYPATPESRWAFRKLEEATCRLVGNGGYSFSDNLLKRLSKNVVLGNGLSDFISAALLRPTVDSNGSLRIKSSEERAKFYTESRLFGLAQNELEDLLTKERVIKDSNIYPNIVIDLAKVSLRVFAPQRAVRVLTDFMYEYPKHMFRGRAQELLGDSLRYSGAIRAAAENYGLALERRDTPTLRWMRFWNLYRSRQYSAALAMLDQPGYVTPREGDQLYIIKYWHGRILENLGRHDEAKAMFAEILKNHGNSFYGVMAATRHPELTSSSPKSDTEPRSIVEETSYSSTAISLAAKSMAARAGVADDLEARTDLRLIADLRNAGLRDAAAAQLSRLRWAGFDKLAAFAAITKLSGELDDYRPSRNIRYTTFTSLRNLPANWDELIASQMGHEDEWKVYYPLAYERIVVPMANHMQLSPFLVLSIMRSESLYNKEARSPVGATGLMQLMPYTALKIATLLHDEEFDIREVTEPEINIGYGLYYLDRLLRYYGDNPFLAAAAYNAGPHAVNQWLATCRDCSADEFVDSIPYFETRRYVREVIRSFDVYSRLYQKRAAMTALPDIPSQLRENEDLF
jgi:soluble lytic murein transglycosylase-like protein